MFLSIWLFISLALAFTCSMCSLCKAADLCLYDDVKYCNDCITRNVTQGIFKLEKYRQSDGETKPTISNYKLPHCYKVQLFTIVFNLIIVALLQFWEDLVFEDSHTCNTDPKIACFPIFPNMTTPRLDCSNKRYLEDNNITSVICYRLALRLGTATASAFGVASVTTMIIYFVHFLLLKPHQYTCSTRWERLADNANSKEWRVTCVLALQIIICVIVVACVTALSYYQLPTCSTHLRRINTIIKNIFVGYTIVYGTVVFPWWQFKTKIYEKENDNKPEHIALQQLSSPQDSQDLQSSRKNIRKNIGKTSYIELVEEH